MKNLFKRIDAFDTHFKEFDDENKRGKMNKQIDYSNGRKQKTTK